MLGRNKGIDERVSEAVKFKEQFDPSPGSSYGWVMDYGLRVMQNIQDTVNTLDRKAESLARYIGPGSGVLGIGLALFAVEKSSEGLAVTIPTTVGVGLLVGAIITALKALEPCEQTAGASVLDAIKIADHYEDENLSIGYFATGIAESIAILRVIADTKARYIRWCHRLFIYSLISFGTALLIPVVEKWLCD